MTIDAANVLFVSLCVCVWRRRRVFVGGVCCCHCDRSLVATGFGLFFLRMFSTVDRSIGGSIDRSVESARPMNVTGYPVGISVCVDRPVGNRPVDRPVSQVCDEYMRIRTRMAFRT